MAHSFTKFAYTDTVKKIQEMYGSRRANAGMEVGPDEFDTLTQREVDFITARDSFYMATVSKGGWPYAQHRGGPKGFIKILDEKTIAFGDFRGNDQYLSVGNLTDDDRVYLFFMDYPNRRRLKLWGHAKLVYENDDLSLLAKLEMPDYDYPVYRAFVIMVAGFDYNCPQHITPRFTESEVRQIFADEFAELEAYRNSGGQQQLPTEEAVRDLGTPLFPAKITAIARRAEGIHEFTFSIPKQYYFAPQVGAHIQIAVMGQDHKPKLNHYSLINAPGEEHRYRIAVQEEVNGSGGSQFLHSTPRVGDTVYVSEPKNEFPLMADAEHSLLIAGGIGITPIYAMAQALHKKGASFEMHYSARSAEKAAFLEDLHQLGCQIYISEANKKWDIEALLKGVTHGTQVYVCGPKGLIQTVIDTAEKIGIDRAQMHFELFGNPDKNKKEDKQVEVVLRQSNKTIMVPVGTSILDAIIAEGIEAPHACKRGECGTCSTKVLEGTPDHRDIFLTPEEKASCGVMCTCVSRGVTDRLVLDL